MDLKPLENTGDISEADFEKLFRARLGDDYERGLAVLRQLGPQHSFSVANVIHLAIQADRAAEMIGKLQRWCEVVVNAPNEAVAYVDTRHAMDIAYGELMLGSDTTIGGLGPFEITGRHGDMVEIGVKQRRSPGGIWLP